MRRNRWRGTILFAMILIVMGATIGLKLYGVGQSVTAAAPTSISSTPPTSTTAPSSSGASGSSSPAPSPSQSASAASATKVITGSVVDTRYGPIQVKVTFVGSKITAIDEVQTPNQDRRSVSINQQAGPILAQEVLASQSAKIDTVSGATYTSDGYKQSLQSAIDQL